MDEVRALRIGEERDPETWEPAELPTPLEIPQPVPEPEPSPDRVEVAA